MPDHPGLSNGAAPFFMGSTRNIVDGAHIVTRFIQFALQLYQADVFHLTLGLCPTRMCGISIIELGHPVDQLRHVHRCGVRSCRTARTRCENSCIAGW
ncbi:MAG: hypothetical protein AAFV53_25835, partial [Myxococcota bacterium]